MARSLSIGGTDLSGASYGVTVVRGPIPIAGPLDQSATNIPGRHGGVASAFARYGPREIECQLHVLGSSWSDLQSKLDAIAYVMRPEAGPQAIVFDERNDRRWVGWLVNQIDAVPIGNGAVEFSARFLIPSGVAEGASQTTQTLTVESDPDTLAVPATGSVGGTAPARPVWKVKNETGGVITTFTITNNTTGDVFTVNYSIADDAYVRINCDAETVEYSTDDSTYTAIASAISSTYDAFPLLAPRVANSITVDGISAGTITLTYRTRFHR